VGSLRLIIRGDCVRGSVAPIHSEIICATGGQGQLHLVWSGNHRPGIVGFPYSNEGSLPLRVQGNVPRYRVRSEDPFIYVEDIREPA